MSGPSKGSVGPPSSTRSSARRAGRSLVRRERCAALSPGGPIRSLAARRHKPRCRRAAACPHVPAATLAHALDCAGGHFGMWREWRAVPTTTCCGRAQTGRPDGAMVGLLRPVGWPCCGIDAVPGTRWDAVGRLRRGTRWEWCAVPASLAAVLKAAALEVAALADAALADAALTTTISAPLALQLESQRGATCGRVAL